MNSFFRATYKILLPLLFLLPLLTLAQTDAHTSTGGLVPCGAGYGFLGATECGLCDLSTLMQNIINFLLGITIPISIGLFAWAGILYFTAVGNPAQIQRARKIFKSVLIGFLIALSGWLVVQTILNALVNQNFFLSGSWNGLQCYPDSARPRESSVGQIFSFGSVTPGGVGVGGASGGAQGGSGGGAALNMEQINERYGALIASSCQNSPVLNCSATVAALIAAESSGNPGATSPKGALGLMQLMPANGGRTCGTGDTACITEQVQKGVAFFANAYATNQNNTTLALAAYNGGQAAVQQSACCATGYAYQCDWDCGTRSPHAVDCTAAQRPSVCVPNTGYVETRNYVTKICRVAGC